MIVKLYPSAVGVTLDTVGAVPVSSAAPVSMEAAMLTPGFVATTVMSADAPFESPVTVTVAPERLVTAPPVALRAYPRVGS